MRRFWALLAPLVTVSACTSAEYPSLDPAARHERVGALAFWYGYDTASVGRDEGPLADLLRHRCAVRKLGPARAPLFARAAAFADRVIQSPAFGALVATKGRWELTRDSGPEILSRLRSGSVEINLFLYDRDDAHPCRADDVLDGHTTAFTPMGDRDVHLTFLYEPYVTAVMAQNNLRELSRTIVHEGLHAMGYSHQGLEPGSERYNNAVPPYLGCVIEHWGGKARQDWIAENCGKADPERAKGP